MRTTRFITNLRKLDARGLNRFSKFINSPYFLERKHLPVIYNGLKKFLPACDISRRDLFKVSFPGRVYKDQLMRKYISELNRMLDRYNAVSSFEGDVWMYSGKLASLMKRSGRYDELAKLSESALIKLGTTKAKDEEFYRNKYIFESYHDLAMNYSMKQRAGLKGESAISGFMDYTAIMILKFCSKYLNNSKIFRPNPDIEALVKIVNNYYEAGKINNPASLAYYYSIRLQLNHEEKEYYFLLKKLLVKNEKSLSAEDMMGMYVFLHNYCYERVDRGEMLFVKERYEVMLQFLLKGYCFSNDLMKPEFFSSMILIALTFHKVKQASEFFEMYKERLPSKNRESLLNFCMSNILLYKKKYEEALSLLGKIKFNDYFDNIRTRTLYIMIFFENGNHRTLGYQADSFRHFLNNHKKISLFVKERTLNFLKQVLQLVKYKEGKAKNFCIKGFEKSSVMNRPWLLQKIEEAKITKNI